MANAYYKNGNSWINMANVFYPVGAYYLANTNTSPSNLFGGTWSNLTGRFLYCNNGTAQNGENSHKLTVSEMPSHRHDFTYAINTTTSYVGGGAALQGSSHVADTPYFTDINTRYVQARGGSTAHNNMPAYRTCYCWYRTA